MKLSRYRESNIPVAMCDWPTLFYFIKMDFAKIPCLKKSAFMARKKGGAK